jgi:hypothetical protein
VILEIIAACSAAALAGLALGKGGAYEERVNRSWATAAGSLGGSLLRHNGWFGPPPMTLEATLDGVEVVAIAGSTIGTAVRPDTEISAKAMAPSDLTIGVARGGGVFASLGQRIDIDDYRLVATANDAELGRAWLDARLCQAMGDALPYSFHLQGGRARATRIGVEEDATRLERAVKAVAALAGRGGRMTDAWDRVAAHLDGMVETKLWAGDEACIRFDRQGLASRLVTKKIPIGPEPVRVTMLLAARGTRSPERFLLFRKGKEPRVDHDMVDASTPGSSILALSTDPATTRERLADRELLEAFEAADPEHAGGTETELSVVFPGLMLDPARLEAAVTLMGRLLQLESAGPYR